MAQIRVLQQQLQNILQQQRQAVGEIRELLRVERTLVRGTQGEDVRALQETLATDPDIYPEGIVSGFFGPLTEAAVRRFQARFDMEQAGIVGPQTREHINYILENGAGTSGIVPPGLLMKFKGKSIFESLPEAAKERCKARAHIPADRIPFGIFAQCDDMSSPSLDDADENEAENEDEEEDAE
jgi:type II secretory pathway pseudopilin PulG